MSPRERQRPAATSSLTPSVEPLMKAAEPPSKWSDLPKDARSNAKATDEDRERLQKLAERAAAAEDLVYLSARVPKSLRTELQLYGVREGVPVAKLLQDAVRAYLDAHNNT